MPTITAKAADMVEHYLTHVFPNGLKAQVVASSREAAVRYITAIDAALNKCIEKLEQDNPLNIDLSLLKTLKTDVVISGNHNDLPHIKAYTDSRKHEHTINQTDFHPG
jgi:type I restriction enzyme R subunit